jgi:predicted DNA-binding transcriptional regulator AlpA
MAQRVGRITEVASTRNKQGMVPVSPATWWRWVKEGKAPAPFKLGPNTTVWDLDQVDAWLAQQAAGGAAQ